MYSFEMIMLVLCRISDNPNNDEMGAKIIPKTITIRSKIHFISSIGWCSLDYIFSELIFKVLGTGPKTIWFISAHISPSVVTF